MGATVKKRANNPSCTCGHARNSHWATTGECQWAVRAAKPGQQPCGCRQFNARPKSVNELFETIDWERYEMWRLFLASTEKGTAREIIEFLDEVAATAKERASWTPKPPTRRAS